MFDFLLIIAFIIVIKNVPINAILKSTIAILVVTKKSQSNKNVILIPNNIQKNFLLFSFEIILDNGLNTNTDIKIDVNASIANAISIGNIFSLLLAKTILGININILNKLFSNLFIIYFSFIFIL